MSPRASPSTGARPERPSARLRRAVAYAIDASPIWLAVALGAVPVLLVHAQVSVFHIPIFDETTGKALPPADLPDTADFALRWLPVFGFAALTQLFSIDMSAGSVGKRSAGLQVVDACGGAITPTRLFAREVLRASPSGAIFAASALLADGRAPLPSLCTLAGGLALLVVVATANSVRVWRHGASFLDAITRTRVVARPL
jgi:uncharacterized RDD family membrane protein YckC